MKKQSIWVFQWRKSVHYWWSYILFSPECKELTSMLDPLLYRWGVPPVVIRCVHWTMQMWVLQTWIKALGLYIIMYLANLIKKYWTCFRYQKTGIFSGVLPAQRPREVRWPPSWKICYKIQFSFRFWGRAVKAFDNFSRKLAWLLKTIF